MTIAIALSIGAITFAVLSLVAAAISASHLRSIDLGDSKEATPACQEWVIKYMTRDYPALVPKILEMGKKGYFTWAEYDTIKRDARMIDLEKVREMIAARTKE